MRVFKASLKIFALIVIIAAVLYGVYFYQVKKTLDDHLNSMRPFFDINYSGLHVNPLGEIRLNTVNVALMGQSGIVIDSVSLTSDPLFFVMFSHKLGRGDWPERLSLSINGLNVDFSMPFFLMLEQMALSEVDGVRLSALGCGNIKQFDMNALRMMGMRHGRFDIQANLRSFDAGPLNLQLYTKMQGWGDLLVDLDVDRNINMAAADDLLQARRVNLSVMDGGFNQRRNQFCSMQAGVSIEEYREDHRLLVNDWITQTQVPVSRELVNAFHRLSEPGSSFSIELNPVVVSEDDLDFSEALINAFLQNLSVTINNQPQIIDSEEVLLFMTMLQQPVVTTVEIIEEPLIDLDAPRSMPGVASPPVAEVPVIVPRVYQETSPNELSNYVGHPIRFFTGFGKKVDGIIVGVEGNVVRVAERVQHGIAEYPVDISSMRGTEVYR